MLKPFIISGLAVGSLYALSGVGMLVLYRATGVLNLAYGALGAMAALISWQLLQNGASDRHVGVRPRRCPREHDAGGGARARRGDHRRHGDLSAALVDRDIDARA